MLRKVLLAGLVVAVALAAWALWLEPASLYAEETELSLPDLPPACAGLRIAVLADLHAGAPHIGPSKVDSVVKALGDAKADLVLLAGDYVIQDVLGGTFMPPEDIAAKFRPLSKTYAVLGNHDWWLDGPRVRDAFEGVGIPVIDNRGVLVEHGACRLWLAGIGDYWEGKPDIASALHGAPDDAAVIALTHNPDVFPQVPSRVMLTVAGHTHGGQVALPLVGRPIVPSEFGERYAVGHIVEDGRHLFVSTGVGTSIFPVRFRVPPEVSVLRLK